MSNFTPSAYEGFGLGDLRSLARKPSEMAFSFTESFLRAVRLMASTAEDPDPHGVAPQVPGADAPAAGEDMDIDRDYDNLDALQAFPGDQHWWLFRPDPHNLGRRECFDLWVTAATTMLEIEMQIVREWPDLQPGNPNWRIVFANNLAFDAFTTPVTTESNAFVVKAEADEPNDQVQHSVILLSLRSWVPHHGLMASTPLRAFVVDTQSVVQEIFESIDFQQRCDGTPCPIEHNGYIVAPLDHEHPLRLFDGDYVHVHAATQLESIRAITADQTGRGIPSLEELPAEFQQRVVTQMADRAEVDELVLLACRAQQAFTSWARDIYDFTHMHQLRRSALAVFLIEADQVVFMRFFAPSLWTFFSSIIPLCNTCWMMKSRIGSSFPLTMRTAHFWIPRRNTWVFEELTGKSSMILRWPVWWSCVWPQQPVDPSGSKQWNINLVFFHAKFHKKTFMLVLILMICVDRKTVSL
jgi:hypothetical protein